MSENLRIHLFGPFEVFRDGQPLTNRDWRSGQTRAICKFLLARQGQVVPSDQFVDEFWPDETLEVARNRLHVRISQLRAALGSGKSLLKTVDGGYIFSPDESCWLDTSAFQIALAEGQTALKAGKSREAIDIYEQARHLYRGEFLAEDLYTDWTFPLREFYRERFLSLLIELSECYAQQGRYRLAVARCQDALVREPLRETIYVRLMLYHYYAGDRTQSLQTYERCCKILEDELAVDALASTHQLAEQIRAGTLWATTDAPRYPPPIYEGRLFEVPYALSETPFVGRDREYAWLIEKLQSRDNRVILVSGEAGVGKSRLVNEFVGYITSQGNKVLRARVSPGAHSPFDPLVTALQPLIVQKNLNKLLPETWTVLFSFFSFEGDLAIDLPKISALSPEGERDRLYEAIHELIEISDPSPKLLLIDDAHRLSLAACELLARISGSIKLLLSYRSEEVHSQHPILSVFGSAPISSATLRLDPLRSSDVQKMIRQLARNELPIVGEEISEHTGGNPLFVVALLQHMFDEGQLFVDSGGGWGVTKYESLSLPSTIRDTIETRLAHLSRTQQQILDIAAVLGGEFDFALLQSASQKSEEALLAVLDDLIDLAFIVEPRSSVRSEFAISHDRYTEVVYESIPGVRKKQLHLRAANAIEQVYADSLPSHFASLAEHFRQAMVVDKECHYAALAGEQAAAQFANTEALHYLSRAIELSPSENVIQLYHLLITREKVYDLLGDRQSQNADLKTLASLINQFNTRQRAEIHLRQAAYDWILGNDLDARANLDKAISLAHACQAIDLKAASYLLRGRGAPDQVVARQDLEMARALAQQDGLRAMEGDIVRCLGNACFWQNSYDESNIYFQEALAIHREVGDLRGELSALNNLGQLSQLMRDPKSARDFFQQGLEICNKIGDRLAEGVLLGNLGGTLAALGVYDQAETYLSQACEIREEIKNDEGVGLLLPVLGDVLRRQGKYAQAKIHLARALAINLRIKQPQQTCLSLDGLSQLYRDMGDYEAALDYFEKALASLDDEQSPNRVRALTNACLLYHLIGDNAVAIEIGKKALTLSQEFPQIQATALTNLGHALLGLGKRDQAVEKYEQALDIRRRLMQSHLIPDPLAGLAQLALEVGADHQALSYVEKILPSIETAPLQGPDRALWIYLTCYRVLQTHQDPRAGEILKSAHNLIQARARSIPDDLLSQSYLEMVAVHREIIRLFQKK